MHRRASATDGGISESPSGRQLLCGTLEFDHGIVDGAPAARFATEFRRLFETGAGLAGAPPP